MENIYLILVVILFALAVSDLIVGVSNDAVNFLNSAIGSKAAPKWLIYFVAALGILIGSTFSSGMMEVARKGVFHPDMLVFSEIMVIFVAVMITDVILLDAFNTFGLPTSTTVSIVFELLGAAVAVSLVKIKNLGGQLSDLSLYINSGKALAIITGILVSVIIAFTIGSLVQYLVRMLFTFNYGKILRSTGAIFGGFAITVITYFILIKGIDGSSFSSIPVGSKNMPLSEWVNLNSGKLLFISLVGWSLFMQLIMWLFKADVLKIVVLVGTFALAMAFAGNDLVNFIGVPIAGFKSYQAWQASGGIDAGQYSMEMLNGEVATPFIFLIISGLVMIATLIFSKKARSVTETEVNLGRQTEGVERFGSSLLARAIVRNTITFNRKINRMIPEKISQKVNARFESGRSVKINDPNPPAFDKIRASVNLMVASILIAFGTSLKLPLSTTYVTFMVAMGSSLADRAWDRESAVYRVSGVFAVIGGWFLTALIAFSVSALIAWLISAGGFPVIAGFLLISIAIVIRTHIIFKRRSATSTEDDDLISEKDETDKVALKCRKQVVFTILSSNKIYSLAMDSFSRDDRTHLREALEAKNELNRKTKKNKNKVLETISKMKKVDVDSGHFYVQVIDYQREMAHSLNFITEPLWEHLENQHKPFNESQAEEIRNLVNEIDEFYNFALHIVKENSFDSLEELISKRIQISNLLIEIEKVQIRRIKNNEVNTRNSLLFFNTVAETKNLLLHSINVVKAYRDFVLVSKKVL
jgi:phosphate/sulfate permease